MKPKSAPTPRTAYSQVLLEQAQVESDARKYYEALMQQGFQLYRSGWYGPAMGRFRQATGVVPKSAYAHLWVGRAGIKAGRYAEARDALARVIELAPTRLTRGQVGLQFADLRRPQGVQGVGGEQLAEFLVRHESVPFASGPRVARSLCIPSRIRVFTVPSGTPSRLAISCCV